MEQDEHHHHRHHLGLADPHALDDDDDVLSLEDFVQHGGTRRRKRKNKRDPQAMRKAPHAPKRFKSSYICFFMAKQSEIKKALGDEANVSSISKRSAEMWKTLPPEDRAHWDDVAAKDKERYMAEKQSYTGPWQVPWKRAKKDPSAPKRPMSAFLQFCQGRRTRLKEENPEMKNTEISRILGDRWKNATEEEKRPYVEKERAEREQYKINMAKWKKEFEVKQEAEKQAQQQQHHQPPGAMPSIYSPVVEPPRTFFENSFSYGHPPVAALPGLHTPHYPYGPYSFPTDGKQPVILGPNGTPVYPNMVPNTEKEFEENVAKKEPPVERIPSPSYNFHEEP